MGFYVNPGGVITIGVVFPALGLIAVFCRFFARIRYKSGLRIDDWLCLPALVLTIAIGTVYIYGGATAVITAPPLDVSLVDVLMDPTYSISKLYKLEYIINIMTISATGLIRLSFVYFYRRIFRGRTFDIVTKTMIGVLIVWIVGMTIALLSVCGSHLPHAWTSLETNTKYCEPAMLNVLGALSVTGFVLDLVIFFIPFPWIWRLQMPLSQRFAVSSVFLCGILTCSASGAKMACGIAALQYVPDKYVNLMGYKSFSNIFGESAVFMFWAYVENGTGMIVCCLPALHPIFVAKKIHRFFARMRIWTPIGSRSSWKLRKSSAESDSQIGTPPEFEKDANRIVVTNMVEQYRIPV